MLIFSTALHVFRRLDKLTLIVAYLTGITAVKKKKKTVLKNCTSCGTYVLQC